jgi:hypothetical protein
MMNPFRRKPIERLPDPTSEATTQFVADRLDASEKERRALQAMVTRLQLKIAADAAVMARSSNEPEPMVALAVGLALVAVKRDWVVDRIKDFTIEGEQRGSRWYVRLSSLIGAKNNVWGL